MTIRPEDIENPELYGHLVGAVQPRPIALASTVDGQGRVNLSPFSFFNVFSAKPPILVFSPVRRGRDGTVKDTLNNVTEHAEVVINIVNYDIVQQMSLSSTEYETGVDEFVKAGLTAVKSDVIKPPRVAESPVQFECKVIDINELGENGGAGSLVICEVVCIHIDDQILDDENVIDPFKIDTVARMGGNWYCRSKDAMFEVAKPSRNHGVGVDALPEHARNSDTLTGNDLGKLGNLHEIPDDDEVLAFAKAENFQHLETKQKHSKAKELIAKNQIADAWKILLS
ncbi:NADH-FMN oxidoreductase RutF, flavin reductase (DIM6/NTAB) family [Nonlabens sp. Hel1_33_55]|uniref:flavin reductase family protein n=1 Tax=Nonlabens sp. Hel1_33_55 TaxID=1336802 RepID=UPI000875D682|nr:flavin reductase family protein [Nonlabens sp. Hel1_33_55]SCY37214.1 NADH-FMN oxidoreductase RutF, flavin reductase (DIM6/NTAB) family [Nonlabens sp. Hel1_33_55]